MSHQCQGCRGCPPPDDARLKEHQHKYTIEELGNAVHFFTKRARHRSDPVKKAKDLLNARNYWIMMGKALDAAEGK